MERGKERYGKQRIDWIHNFPLSLSLSIYIYIYRERERERERENVQYARRKDILSTEAGRRTDKEKGGGGG